MADGVAARGPRLGRPAPAHGAPRARVETQPRDDHVHVTAVGVDRHPGAGTGLAPARERAGRHRVVEQARAVQRVGHGARAVVARVVEVAVAAAVLVRLALDLVRRRDDLLDLRRGVGGRDRFAVGPDGGRAGRRRHRCAAQTHAAGLDGPPQRGDVGRAHHAVGLERRGSLERLDRLARAAPELAVDVGVVARLREVVLEDADVLAAHAGLQRRTVSELGLRGGRDCGGPEQGQGQEHGGSARQRRTHVGRVLFSFVAYGVSCRARAERAALRRRSPAIRPRPQVANGSPVPLPRAGEDSAWFNVVGDSSVRGRRSMRCYGAREAGLAR
jgi:hypothetical protein